MPKNRVSAENYGRFDGIYDFKGVYVTSSANPETIAQQDDEPIRVDGDPNVVVVIAEAEIDRNDTPTFDDDGRIWPNRPSVNAKGKSTMDGPHILFGAQFRAKEWPVKAGEKVEIVF